MRTPFCLGRTAPLAVLVALACLGWAPAAAGSPARLPYTPGKVRGVPLSKLDPALRTAYDELAAEHFDAARTTFQAAVDRAPGNLAALVGLIQSCPDRLPTLRTELERSPVARKAASIDLARSLIGIYGALGPLPGYSKAGLTSRELNLLRGGLRRAWDQTHDPVAGFLCAEWCGAASNVGNEALMALMTKYAGADVVARYRRLKAADWKGEPMPVPALPGDRLWMVERIVSVLCSDYSGVSYACTPVIHGNKVTYIEHIGRMSERQERALMFHYAWDRRLRKKLGLPDWPIGKPATEAIKARKRLR